MGEPYAAGLCSGKFDAWETSGGGAFFISW